MNILVINGSPRGTGSNSYKLASAFLEGVKQETERMGDAVWTEELQVNQMNIKPCLGCFGCWRNTPGTCCIRDDMQEVMDKLLWADVTVWSFPLYYYTVPGSLKNLIDRQLPMMLPFMVDREDGIGNGSHPSRYDMSGKKTVVISTCGFYTAEGNYDGVCSLFDHMCGKGQYTAVFCGQGELFRVPEVSKKTGAYLARVTQAGKEYAHGGISEDTWEGLKELIYPKDVFERMADASWGISKESGEKEADALVFTRQMAATYQKESYAGMERVLEMYYTDTGDCYQIVMGKEGSKVLTDGSRAFTTRIETPLTVWRSIAAGEIRGDEALMKHLYKVKGDFDLMLHWDQSFGGGSGAGGGNGSPETGGKGAGGIHMPDRETNMNLLLIPWIVFWTMAPIWNFWGGLAGITACVLMPLLFYRNKKTVYDCLTGVLTAGCSMALLAGAPARAVIPLSYLMFGVMWTVSCFFKIPLTAHYSMNGYDGEKALENPLFMKTNRILTFLWGILYLFTPVWTYAIMGTKAGYLVGAVNAVCPIGLGIFTGWFQKWYPAKTAQG